MEAQLEDRPRLGAADDELSVNLGRDRQVLLAAERDRLELDLLLYTVLFPRPQPE
jgi:hypothetical protein